MRIVDQKAEGDEVGKQRVVGKEIWTGDPAQDLAGPTPGFGQLL